MTRALHVELEHADILVDDPFILASEHRLFAGQWDKKNVPVTQILPQHIK
jgi:hypothetical protein